MSDQPPNLTPEQIAELRTTTKIPAKVGNTIFREKERYREALEAVRIALICPHCDPDVVGCHDCRHAAIRARRVLREVLKGDPCQK